MTRAQFLSGLRQGLSGLPVEQIDEIVDDYDAHFAEGMAAGRSEESVAAALGHPARLARELRAEAGLRRWEEKRSPENFVGALVALIGLVAVDLIFLLPILFVVALVVFIVGVVALAIMFAGLVVVASLFGLSDVGSLGEGLARGFAGVGLFAGGVGLGALLILFCGVLIRVLGHYARLHYQLLNSSQVLNSSKGAA